MIHSLFRILLLIVFGAAFDGLQAQSISHLSDEFDDSTSLANWTRLNDAEGWNADKLEVHDVNGQRPGHMRMMPHTTVWFMDMVGPLAYKEVTGDFAVTMQLDVSRRNGLAGRPSRSFSVAGILMRAPRSISAASPDPDTVPGSPHSWPPDTYTTDWTPDGENYVYVSLGSGGSGAANQWNYESKSTENGQSTFYSDNQGVPADVGTVTLQAVRRGDTIVFLRRHGDGEWIVENRYIRPDLPDTLQVGMTAYGDWPNISGNELYSGPNDHEGQFHHNHNVISVANGFTSSPDIVADADYIRFIRPGDDFEEQDLQSLPLTSSGGGVQFLSATALNDSLGDSLNQPYEPEGGSPPVQPTGISATYQPPVSNGVVLDWETTPNTDSYEIQRGTSSDPAGMVQIATAVDSSYTDTSVTGGQTYFYRVRGVNSDGAGPFTDPENAMVLVPEDLPRPDLTVGKSIGRQKGNGVSNSSGAGQVLGLTAKRMRKVRAHGTVGNKSLLTDQIMVRGSRGNRYFRIKYFLFGGGRHNVTGAATRGVAATEVLAPGAKERYQVDIKPARKPRTKTFRLSGASGGVTDLVRIKVKSKM